MRIPLQSTPSDKTAIEQWICPFCNVAATLRYEDIERGNHPLFSGSNNLSARFSWEARRCPNPSCNKISLQAEYQSRRRVDTPSRRISWNLRPESTARPQPDYIPASIREDYFEACLIVSRSPKASATLARRCLQGMIRDFWKIEKKWLVKELEALEGLVDSDTWESIRAVKDTASFAAHPELDVNTIITITSDEALVMIELIEQLFDDWYVQRHKRQERKNRILQMASDKKNLRSAPQC